MAPEGAGSSDGRKVLWGPKTPVWGCRCGQSDNFASRIECRGCGKPAPRTVLDKAKAADAERGTGAPKTNGKPAARGAAAGSANGGVVATLQRRLNELEAKLKSEPAAEAPSGSEDTAGQKTQEEIRHLEAAAASLKLAGLDDDAQRIKETLAKKHEEKWAAKPLRAQQSHANSYAGRLQAQLVREDAKRAELEVQLTQLQAQIDESKQKSAKLRVDVAAANQRALELAGATDGATKAAAHEVPPELKGTEWEQKVLQASAILEAAEAAAEEARAQAKPPAQPAVEQQQGASAASTAASPAAMDISSPEAQLGEEDVAHYAKIFNVDTSNWDAERRAQVLTSLRESRKKTSARFEPYG